MDLTLNLPDDLAERLRPHEDLVRILELGLRSLGVEDEDSELEASDELPEAWRAALGGLMSQRSTDMPLPSPEELVAYHRNELKPAEEEKLVERLALHPEAARDLLDLVRFDRPEASDDEPGHADVSQALRRFRSRVATLPETETAEAVHPFPSPSAARAAATPYLNRGRWLGLAAALVLAAGALWVPWFLGRQAGSSGSSYAAIIDVTASRGARSFPVSGSVGELLLILPLAESVSNEGTERTLRILAEGGDEIFRDTLRKAGDPWSRLYLRLPRDRFGPGIYHIEILNPSGSNRTETRDYRFAIEYPPDSVPQ